MKSKRLLLVEDHALLREGFRTLLEGHDDLQVVGEARDGREAVERYAELRPDLTIMDLAMPGMDGARAIREIKKSFPAAKVIVLTAHAAEEYIYSALRAGADGYALKEAPAQELLLAIRTVLDGNHFISPGISKKLIDGYLKGKKADEFLGPWRDLTDREMEVLRLAAQGCRNKDVAEVLFISVKTVEKHRANLMRKLGLHNAAELKALARAKGLATK
jgi:two-component system, NarL family, response regulator NreC